MTLPVRPSRRRSPLRTVTGSKVPLRSRGTRRATLPISVVTVLGCEPLRLLPDPRPSTACGSSPPNGTLRGPDTAVPAPTGAIGNGAALEEAVEEVEVISRDPLQPATLSRGPSDHARLHTPSDTPSWRGSASLKERGRVKEV